MDSGILKKIDWLLVFLILPIITAGLFTMKSFAPTEGTGNFFEKQLIWVAVSLGVFFIFSFIDFRFLKRTDILVFLFVLFSVILLSLFVLGYVAHGSKAWFNLGLLSFQPVDMMNIGFMLLFF